MKGLHASIVQLCFALFLLFSLSHCIQGDVEVCRTKADCPATKSHCVTGVCSECSVDADCPSGTCSDGQCSSVSKEWLREPVSESSVPLEPRGENTSSEPESSQEWSTDASQEQLPEEATAEPDIREAQKDTIFVETTKPEPILPEVKPEKCIPTKEVCNGKDDDCDGTVDEGCCTNNAKKACYTGPASTRKKGECRDGYSICVNKTWGKCLGQRTPVSEVCDNKDNDCDGKVDDGAHLNGASCSINGAKGNCQKGKRFCRVGTTTCIPSYRPSPESCDKADNDCDGLVDEGCKPWFVPILANGLDEIRDIHLDKNDNAYIVGVFDSYTRVGSLSLSSARNRDVFVAKIDYSGNVLWARAVGGSGQDYGTTVGVDSALNVYVGGTFENTVSFGSTRLSSRGGSDFFIAKMDSKGNWLWAVQGGGRRGDLVRHLTVDGIGNTYFTGSFSDLSTFGTTRIRASSSHSIYVAKVSTQGKYQWVRPILSGAHSEGRVVKFDSFANLYVTGACSGDTYFGNTKVQGKGDRDIFWAKLDTNGKILAHWVAGGKDFDAGFALVADSVGQFYVAGIFAKTVAFGTTTLTAVGNKDFFVAKFDKNGKMLWVRGGGTKSQDYVRDITLDKTGNLLMIGVFNDCESCVRLPLKMGAKSITSKGLADGFIAKMDKNGTMLTAVSFGSRKGDKAFGIAVNRPGYILLTGTFQDTVHFKSQSLVSKGNYDAFVGLFDPALLFK